MNEKIWMEIVKRKRKLAKPNLTTDEFLELEQDEDFELLEFNEDTSLENFEITMVEEMLLGVEKIRQTEEKIGHALEKIEAIRTKTQKDWKEIQKLKTETKKLILRMQS